MKIQDIPLDKRLRFWFGLLLSTLLIISVISYSTITNLIDTANWVSHTHEVISSAEKVFTDCQDMETGVRGYYIIGREEFLQTYIDANKIFYKDIRDFKNLTIDNPVQQKRVEELLIECNQKVDICEQIIQATRTKGYDDAAKLATIVYSRAVMQRIRVIVNEAIAEEQRLLITRRQVADDTCFRAKVVLPTLIILDFLLKVIGYSYITNKLAK